MLFISANPDANRRNFLWLCLLRAILIVVLVLGMVVLASLGPVSLLKDSGILAALSLLTVMNVGSLWYFQQQKPVTEKILFIQLLVDVLVMSLIFYRTGGSSNPFVFWYLLPLSIAAAVLRLHQTLLLLLLTLVLYGLLFFYFIPFELFSGGAHSAHAGHESVSLVSYQALLSRLGVSGNGLQFHMIGMWLNFVFSAVLITFFVTRMSEALRHQDREIAHQHESLLQREQVLSLGALAAGAAHELGTPLSTMAILAKDIESDLPQDSALRQDVGLLRSQLQICRNILAGLREQAQGNPRVAMEDYLKNTINRMEVLHPQCAFKLLANVPAVSVQVPATFSQVLINLLDNAAQAACKEVQLMAKEEGDICILWIDDDGSGIAPDVALQLGKTFVTSKDEGMGLGYFLSHASINQLGGSIHFKTLPQGGTRVELRLPWSALGRQEV